MNFSRKINENSEIFLTAKHKEIVCTVQCLFIFCMARVIGAKTAVLSATLINPTHLFAQSVNYVVRGKGKGKFNSIFFYRNIFSHRIFSLNLFYSCVCNKRCAYFKSFYAHNYSSLLGYRNRLFHKIHFVKCFGYNFSVVKGNSIIFHSFKY